MRQPIRIVSLVLAAAALLATVLWRREAGRAATAEAESAQLRTSVAGLTAKLGEAAPSASPLVEPVAPVTPAPGKLPPTERTVFREDTATRDELVKLVDEKQARIAELTKAREEADERIREAESKLAAASADHKRLAEAEQEWKLRLDAAARTAAELESELKGRGDRAVRIDAANRELTKKAEDAAKKLAAVTRTAGEISDVARRRDQHLANLQRRYRELTDAYRTLAVRVNNARESAPPITVADLSRMQNAVQLAEDDLRQLQSLSAEAARLHKELSAISVQPSAASPRATGSADR